MNPNLVLEFTQKSLFTKTTFKMVEKYDMATVKAMIKSPFLNTVIPDDWFFPFENEKKQLEALLKCIKNNTFVCDYDFTGVKVGRVYTTKTLGFISLRKELRAVFANGQYADIDIENAHPTIINQLCSDMLKLTILPDYVNNRSKYFNILMNNYNLSREDSKRVMISILYGAGLNRLKADLKTDDLPAWILQLKDEIKQVCKYVIQFNPKLKQLVGLERDGSQRSDCGLLSYYVQEYERIILETVYNFLITKGIFTGNRDNGALCYDGIMILKDKYNESLLTELSDEIKNKLGFDLKFTCKDLEIKPEIQQYLEQDNSEEENTELEQWYKETKLEFEYGKTDINDSDEPIRFKCDNFYIEKERLGMRLISAKDYKEKHNDYSSIKIDKKEYSFFNKWYSDVNKAKYDNLVFDLDRENCDKSLYNLFKGYSIEKNNAEINENEILTLIEPLIGDNGLIYNLCGKSKEVLEWFLKYLSGILLAKKSEQRPGVMVIFRDTLGVLQNKSGGNGKDSFFRWFSNKIVGLDFYYECSKTDELFEHFNKYLSNKILVNIPECGVIIKEKKNWSSLKNYVDAPEITITSKGINPIKMTNYMNIVASTNDDFTPPYDRRVLMIDVCSDNKGNTEYWSNIHNNVLSNDRVAKAFYLYLTKIIKPYESTGEFQNAKDLLVVDAQEEAKENKKSLIQSFFEDCHKLNLIKNTDILTSHLLKLYINWCDKNNFKCDITSNGFGQKLTRMIKELEKLDQPIFLEKKKISGFGGFKINLESLKQWYLIQFPEEQCLIDDDDAEIINNDEKINALKQLKSLADTNPIFKQMYHDKLKEFKMTELDL